TLCTGAQICQAGSCVTGKAVNCDDVNPCTADACEAKQGGCLHAPLDATPGDDNSACSTDDTCAKGSCVGNTLPCNDNEACSDDSCDPKTGCVHLAVAATACDDQDPCTVGDTCGGGKCLAGKDKLGCDDGVLCTNDNCTPATGCTHVPDSKACDDNNPCMADVCDPLIGCKYLATTDPCSDNTACTVGDQCSAGNCNSGKAVNCDDGNACTDDSCDATSGCTHSANAAACTQNGLCGVCSGGTCAGATALWQWSVGSKSANDSFRALAVMPDGGFAVVGSTNSAGLGVPWGNDQDFWTRRTDAQGKLLWDDVRGGAGLFDDVAMAVATLPNGNIVSTGILNGKLLVLCQNAAGDDLWTYSDVSWGEGPGGTANWSTATSVLPLADGGVAVAGWLTGSIDGRGRGWLVRLNGDGTGAWAKTFGWQSAGGQTMDRTVGALAAWNGSGFAVLGYAAKAVQLDPSGELVATFVSGDGTSATDKKYAFVVADSLAAVPQPGGELAVVSGASLARIGADTNLYWHRTVFAGTIESLTPIGGGYFVLVGEKSPKLGISVVDGLGNTTWESFTDWQGESAKASAVLPLGDGGLAIAGRHGSTITDMNALLFRTDAFGHTTCGTAGICLGKAATACTDDNPCTADGCDPATGCSHQPVGSGYGCEFGPKSCIPSGICIADKCEAFAPKCADDSACTADSCDAKTGDCVFVPLVNGSGCDDGKPCTVGDGCVAGTCAGTPMACGPSEKCQVGLCVAAGPSGTATVMGGKFTMGCVAGDSACSDHEKPPHVVDVSLFFIDVTEVAIAQYANCYAEGACTTPGQDFGCNWGVLNHDLHPANCVTWEQAKQFCEWKGGRLPTEAEWEKAARAGLDGSLYANGKNNLSCQEAVFTGLGYFTCKNATTAPVASKLTGTNALGLYDMAGNVSEWVADSYGYAFYSVSPKVNPLNSIGSNKVSRGGNYAQSPSFLRASARFQGPPQYGLETLGFRCAYSAP
ncbi:MAG: SUMF1/EgtB/PvdO family nonheme iron enzyme, partial [Deltaproteobacteria bacterium]|nr:SUMF1/EgtB/PvdO family nonheme iron enzyme [Deltaproteobacteria bacterium]